MAMLPHHGIQSFLLLLHMIIHGSSLPYGLLDFFGSLYFLDDLHGDNCRGTCTDQLERTGGAYFCRLFPIPGCCVRDSRNCAGDRADWTGDDRGDDFADLGDDFDRLLQPLGHAPVAVEVGAVDGVAGAVVVGAGVAAGHRVDLQEAAEGRAVEAGTHEDVAVLGLGGALLAAEPAVADARLAVLGDAGVAPPPA
ncbi:hypothetical protein ADK60_17495 [Streptomyces sp. XY431]|nr:hypothetical protein ADK60_17495 [Streptomyces sp. XY431]